MNKGRVLLVDDNIEFTKVLSERLSFRGYEVATVSSGPEALREVAAAAPDVVVLDFVMPEMDGAETLVAMRELAPYLPVVILTGYSTGGVILKLGAKEVLVKPVDLDVLTQHLDALISGAGRPVGGAV